MKTSKETAWRDRFPHAQMVIGFEGGAVYQADEAGKYYLIRDEGALQSFLEPGVDDDLLEELVEVQEFPSAEERLAYIKARGWLPPGATART